MRRPTLLTSAAAAVLVLLSGAAASLQTPPASTPGSTPASAATASGRVDAFTGARVIADPRKPPIDDAVMLVRAGRIEQIGPRASVPIPAGATRHDLAGKTIIPGLINAHGHVGDTRGMKSGPELYTRENVLAQLGVYGRYGVTTVFSLGGDREEGFKIRDAQNVPALGHARLFVAGPIVTGDTPEAARQVVGRVAAMKADFVKIRVDDNLGTSRKMPQEIYEAVISEAHKQKLRVAVHLYYQDDARTLLAAGADLIAHSIRDQPVGDDVVATLKKQNVCVCPTLTREVSTFVYEQTPEWFTDPFFTREFAKTAEDTAVLEALKDPKRQGTVKASTSAQQYKKALDMASRNLKALQDAGVGIAFGTDTGPPARFQGYFEHMELELMVKAGLTPGQALTAATSGAADCMKVTGQLGALAPGAWADFVVLDRNPLEDIRNTRTIASVWVGGGRLNDDRKQ
jgi:imidazolonepropionase-like amidohydrolase